MKTYCVKCTNNTENIDSKIVRTKNYRVVMQSKYSVSRVKKSIFIKEQDAKGWLSNLGIKTPLSKIPLLNVLFWMQLSIKMNEIVKTFLLVGDKFMPEMHLKQPGFIYSACGHLPKIRIEKFMQTGNTDYIYKN